MSAGNFRGDEEAESEAMLTGTVAARKRLEQVLHRFTRNRRAEIRDSQFEGPVALRLRGDANRLLGIAMSDGIAEQIGEKLTDLGSIAVDRLFDIDIRFDDDERPDQLQLTDDLFENRR